MPAIVGPVNIGSADGGVVNFGDIFYVSPKESVKTAAGSGAFNNGNFVVANNGLSATNLIDPDVSDMNNTANK